MFRKPIDTRTIIPTHNETVETQCEGCEQSTLKVMRVEVETQKRLFEKSYYLSVKLRCKCDNCGLKQTVQLVEMP
jgi:hypothetical protein